VALNSIHYNMTVIQNIPDGQAKNKRDM
jgi:hypothetical protein